MRSVLPVRPALPVRLGPLGCVRRTAFSRERIATRRTAACMYLIPTAAGRCPVHSTTGRHPIHSTAGQCPIRGVTGRHPIQTAPGRRLIRRTAGRYPIHTAAGRRLIRSAAGRCPVHRRAEVVGPAPRQDVPEYPAGDRPSRPGDEDAAQQADHHVMGIV
ncbi:MAG: hypothetical protein ACRDP6_06705, partial [Actinoallomurus sp.]